ncbi:hypothetical protein [Streptomyces sediminimaris]|uniref:hypothetical protein n=1 Tax=Streptomyces sediminimaris TaxID=3383721 RepID=UPI00399B4D9B
MTTPQKTAAAITAAEQEAHDAEELITALEERVRDGDTDVSPEQLAAQRDLGRFARLRAEAARRKHERALAADRDQRAQDAAQRARQLLADDSTEPILDAAQDAVTALARLAKLARDRNTAVQDVATQVVDANEELKQAGAATPWPMNEHGVRAGHVPVPSVTVSGHGRVQAADPGELAAAALVVALGADVGAQQRARDLLAGMRNSRVRSLGAAVPGLADAWRVSSQEWQATDALTRSALTEQGRRPLKD